MDRAAEGFGCRAFHGNPSTGSVTSSTPRRRSGQQPLLPGADAYGSAVPGDDPLSNCVQRCSPSKLCAAALTRALLKAGTHAEAALCCPGDRNNEPIVAERHESPRVKKGS